MENWLERACAAEGKIGIYYRPLDGGAAQGFHEDMPLLAASVIKIPIMAAAFVLREEGKLSFDEEYVLRDADKMPSCGALNRMHAGLRVTVRDLVELMIILSDNTATNVLIDRMGMENINAVLRSLGLTACVLRRKLFDAQASTAGLENTVSAREIGILLERMHAGTLVSAQASAQMLDILRSQRLNGKMPFYLKPQGIASAHKTGEDNGITHDVGIVYAKRPFVLCMLSNETNVPAFERIIQETARDLAAMNG